MIATRQEWHDQPPSIVAHRRLDELKEINRNQTNGTGDGVTHQTHTPSSSTARGSKRKASSGPSTRRVYEHETDESESSTLPSGGVHRLAPSFEWMKNDRLKATHDPNAMTDTVETSAIPVAAISKTPHFDTTIPRLAKRAKKALTQDYAAFKSNLSRQAMRVLNETLPRAILRLKDREEEFSRQLASLPEVEPVEFYFVPKVTDALAKAATQLGSEPTDANKADRLQPLEEEKDEPITRWGQHKFIVRNELPKLGAEQIQHGWTFYQPTRAQPSHSFNSSWVRLLQGELGDFHSVLELLHTFFTQSLPSAGDANNQALEMMEQLLKELTAHIDWTDDLRGRIGGYTEQRAELLSKVYKYPGVADYHAAISEIDSYIRLTLHLNLSNLRNAYTLIHQLYLRNEDKLQGEEGDEAAFNAMI